MEDWSLTVGVTGLLCGLGGAAAVWAVGRENLRLRRDLDGEIASFANAHMAANALRDTLRKVWADRRHATYENARVRDKLRSVLRRVWASRREYQQRHAEAIVDRDTLANEYADAATDRYNGEMFLDGLRDTDASSLAMCDELARYDIGGEAGV